MEQHSSDVQTFRMTLCQFNCLPFADYRPMGGENSMNHAAYSASVKMLNDMWDRLPKPAGADGSNGDDPSDPRDGGKGFRGDQDSPSFFGKGDGTGFMDHSSTSGSSPDNGPANQTGFRHHQAPCSKGADLGNLQMFADKTATSLFNPWHSWLSDNVALHTMLEPVYVTASAICCIQPTSGSMSCSKKSNKSSRKKWTQKLLERLPFEVAFLTLLLVFVASLSRLPPTLFFHRYWPSRVTTSTSTLDKIRARGNLHCGVSNSTVGLSIYDEFTQKFQGFESDLVCCHLLLLCRSLSRNECHLTFFLFFYNFHSVAL